MLMQVISILGALLVLGAYAANQLDRLGVHSYPYLLMNLLGAGALTVSAIATRQAGLILVEGAWTLISVVGLLRALRRPVTPTP
jgi:hypothetical protein